VATASPQLVPVRCRKTKNETKKEQYLEKQPEHQGGGSIPKLRVKRIYHYECDLVPAQPVQEEKKKEKKKAEKKQDKKAKNPCNQVGNKFHSSSTGKFTSHEDEDYCQSLWFSCRSGGRRKGKKGSRSTQFIQQPANAGRHSKDEPRKVKCSTNQKLTKEEMTQAEQERVIKQETARLTKKRKLIIRIGKKK